MAYHGEDLDLRTPQTWGSAPVDAVASGDHVSANGKRGSMQQGPVLVDDAVLACFNQAYDIASAHRAGEVRIEHLLNAMTRLDASAVALEGHGIRVLALKRETATIIAGDIPAVPGSGPVSPRRSEEVADVLKYAAAFASRRNAAVTIEDILQVLFEHRSEFGASDLLLRFAPRAPEPLPPLTRSEPRYAPSPYRYPAEYSRSSYRQEYLGTPTDALQNSRIESLEQTVRALGQDLSNERHAIAGLIRDLARDTVAHQDDQGRSQGLLLDRLAALETAFRDGRGGSAGSISDPAPLIAKLGDIEAGLELRLQEMSQSWAILSSRLQELENSIRERALPAEGVAGLASVDGGLSFDLKPIADRLDVIEEAVLGNNRDQSGFVDIGDRLSRLEDIIGQAIATPGGEGQTEGSSGGLETLAANFDGLTGKIDTHFGSLSDIIANLTERVGAAERAVAAEIETSAAKHQAYTHDLTEVHEALLKVNQNQHTLAGSMDQWRTESAGDVASILNRLGALDRNNAIPAETLSALNSHMDAMNRFIIERYHRRHRFMYWLFGTDDWMSASWPSARAAIDAEHQRLQEVGKAEA
ncbi:Clp protease [Hyphomicrobium sp.]|uniref:Clp protease n=1 Tax=Hyphomicrobium sp. TaxID=82 RepID=UPI000FAC5836|nr:Clp protease [Hyphomicrobium sp.]RUO97713.1 MAG: Clp protease [Hyphomicrobium sp.]